MTDRLVTNAHCASFVTVLADRRGAIFTLVPGAVLVALVTVVVLPRLRLLALASPELPDVVGLLLVRRGQVRAMPVATIASAAATTVALKW